MALPNLLIGFLVSTLFGAAFHLWRGGGAGRLLLYLILGWVGFWAGQFLAARMGWTIGSLGPLNLGIASLTCLAFLGVGHWLSLVEVERK